MQTYAIMQRRGWSTRDELDVPGVPVRAVAKGPIEWTITLVIPGPFDGSPAPLAQTNLSSGPCD